jgi:methylated-DNA-protein-cysteine methyltransferase related protein
MTDFQQAVLNVVRIVPQGKVVSYGQVAAYVGTPRAARQVGWTMRSLEGAPNFPWWRVLNNAGRISIKGNQFNTAKLQKDLLESEDVEVNSDFTLSMAKYRFRPTADQLSGLKLDPEYIKNVLVKYGLN